MTSTHQPPARPRALCWIWPIRHSERLGRWVLRFCEQTQQVSWSAQLLIAFLAGWVPLVLAYFLGLPKNPLVTALCLAPLLWGGLIRDRQFRCFSLLGVSLLAHCLGTIILALADPVGTASILPGAAPYWERTYLWVTTGTDPEYDPVNWLPAHVGLLAWTGLATFTSLGIVPLAYGMEQLDLMNFYVAQLLRRATHPVPIVLAGWHPWSIARGLACSFLLCEVTSWSLQRLTGLPTSTPARRRQRWCWALFFVLVDAGLKYALLDWVRNQLSANIVTTP